MRSLYEKLNRLDDSLVESKRIVKKKNLTESTEKTTIEVKFEPYTRYGYEPVKTARVSGKDLLDALLNMSDRMRLYVNSDYADEYEEEYGVKLTAETFLERIEEENGDGCDFIYYIKNLTTGEMLFDSEYEESEDWDDDIDEMLTEENSAREKLMNTYPDDFGHWEPYNRNTVKPTKVPPKTLDQYARDPETEVVEFDHNSTNSFKELGARKKLLKAFPDLKIEAYEPLEEAIKDSDYVIVLTHPNMPQDKRYSFFGSNYRMTRDLNKAMTYPGEFSAKDEIKYALDATDGHWDPSYADRFSVMTVSKVKELLNAPKPEKISRAVHHNVSAQEAAKPIAKEIHEVIKKHNVSLSSFLMLIKELVKSEDPNA